MLAGRPSWSARHLQASASRRGCPGLCRSFAPRQNRRLRGRSRPRVLGAADRGDLARVRVSSWAMALWSTRARPPGPGQTRRWSCRLANGSAIGRTGRARSGRPGASQSGGRSTLRGLDGAQWTPGAPRHYLDERQPRGVEGTHGPCASGVSEAHAARMLRTTHGGRASGAKSTNSTGKRGRLQSPVIDSPCPIPRGRRGLAPRLRGAAVVGDREGVPRSHRRHAEDSSLAAEMKRPRRGGSPWGGPPASPRPRRRATNGARSWTRPIPARDRGQVPSCRPARRCSSGIRSGRT